MPYYTYECTDGHITEDVVQSIKDEPLIICPQDKCEAGAKRLICDTIFRLKGSGWTSTIKPDSYWHGTNDVSKM